MCIARMGMTLGDFFSMSLYDLMILIESYNNERREEWYHTRAIAYANYCATWANPKKRPVSINKYMPIDDEDYLINDESIDRMLKNLEIAQQEYRDKVKAKKLVN